MGNNASGCYCISSVLSFPCLEGMIQANVGIFSLEYYILVPVLTQFPFSKTLARWLVPPNKHIPGNQVNFKFVFNKLEHF